MTDRQNGGMLGGRKPLPQLIDDGIIPYKDPRQAKRFLDRYGVPYVIIRRQRCYRPPAIREALDRHEQDLTTPTAA
jgi:hypothetical protein